jgi:hypothetical protein
MPRKHWTEILSCPCGKRFRSAAAEAHHRHNFPALCRKPPESKHTKRRDALMARMRKGEILCREVSREEAGGHRYWLEPSGRPVGPWTAAKAIGLPEVVEHSGGLLEGSAQSWRVKEKTDAA